MFNYYLTDIIHKYIYGYTKKAVIITHRNIDALIITAFVSIVRNSLTSIYRKLRK